MELKDTHLYVDMGGHNLMEHGMKQFGVHRKNSLLFECHFNIIKIATKCVRTHIFFIMVRVLYFPKINTSVCLEQQSNFFFTQSFTSSILF